MNSFRMHARSGLYALALAAALCAVPGTFRTADAQLATEGGGRNPTALTSAAGIGGPSTDSFWGRMTCGFSMLIAGRNSYFLSEAIMICNFIAAQD